MGHLGEGVPQPWRCLLSESIDKFQLQYGIDPSAGHCYRDYQILLLVPSSIDIAALPGRRSINQPAYAIWSVATAAAHHHQAVQRQHWSISGSILDSLLSGVLFACPVIHAFGASMKNQYPGI
uniref:Uncharacterized protein n=1 Tax=Oryza glaberrima TaxID=4538 RepID=I1Q807_ORYGL